MRFRHLIMFFFFYLNMHFFFKYLFSTLRMTQILVSASIIFRLLELEESQQHKLIFKIKSLVQMHFDSKHFAFLYLICSNYCLLSISFTSNYYRKHDIGCSVIFNIQRFIILNNSKKKTKLSIIDNNNQFECFMLWKIRKNYKHLSRSYIF